MITDRNRRLSVDVIIPAYRPGAEMSKLLSRLALQTLLPDKIIIVNTEKKYWKDSITDGIPFCEVIHISKKDFDHGSSRHMAAERSAADILVFMTQDAYPADRDLLKNLIRPIAEGESQIAYARQLPKKGEGVLESYSRHFNYPPESRIKSLADTDEMGIRTFFCSNVCAAYDHGIYDELGGFPRPVFFNEDMIFASNAMHAGYKVAYAADARVFHSHTYGARKLFRRNFDIGASQAMNPEIFEAYPSIGEGTKLVKESAKYVCRRRKFHLLFAIVWQNGWKFLGYSFGKRYRKLPKNLIKKWSDCPECWERLSGGNDV